MTASQLQEYVATGNIEQLSDALKDNPGKASVTTSMGVSLITFASYYRNQDAIKVIRPYLSSLSIHEACCIGETDTVQAFLEKDSSLINAFSTDGFTPLGLASFFSHLDLVASLISKGANVNTAANNSFKVAPIHSACAISNEAIVQALITAGADVNATQQKGVRPIHSACHNGHLGIVKLLVAAGADHKAPDEDGKLPMDYAEEKAFSKILDYLKTLL